MPQLAHSAVGGAGFGAGKAHPFIADVIVCLSFVQVPRSVVGSSTPFSNSVFGADCVFISIVDILLRLIRLWNTSAFVLPLRFG